MMPKMGTRPWPLPSMVPTQNGLGTDIAFAVEVRLVNDRRTVERESAVPFRTLSSTNSDIRHRGFAPLPSSRALFLCFFCCFFWRCSCMHACSESGSRHGSNSLLGSEFRPAFLSDPLFITRFSLHFLFLFTAFQCSLSGVAFFKIKLKETQREACRRHRAVGLADPCTLASVCLVAVNLSHYFEIPNNHFQRHPKSHASFASLGFGLLWLARPTWLTAG